MGHDKNRLFFGKDVHAVFRNIGPALSRCQDVFMVGMVACFILGCLSGVMVIALA